jgi:phospholipase D1/2
VREIEALYDALIDGAERTLYLENQYLTVRRLADRLRERLDDPDGPEVVIVTPTTAEGLLEAAVMDQGRARFVARLAQTDHSERLRVGCPVVLDAEGRRQPVDLHSKLAIVDEVCLTIGSANLANRSMGLDTECNLTIVAQTDEHRRAITRARASLLADHLGFDVAQIDAALASRGSVIAALADVESEHKRLEQLPEIALGALDEVGLPVDLGDPQEPLSSELLQNRLLPSGRRRRLRTLLLRFGIVLAVLVALAVVLHDQLVGEAGLLAEVLRFAEAYRYSILGLTTAMLSYVVASLLFVPINLLIALTAMAFGPVAGFAYALAGSLAAAVAGFGLGRLLGRDLVHRIGGRRVAAINRRLERRGLITISVVRMLPVAPFTVVNLVAGASGLRWRDYVLGTVLGLAPGIALMTLVGDRIGAWLRHPDAITFGLLVAAAALALVGGLLLHRWQRQGRSA